MTEKIRAYQPQIDLEYVERTCLKCNEVKQIQVPKRICKECTESNENSRFGKNARYEKGGAYHRGRGVK